MSFFKDSKNRVTEVPNHPGEEIRRGLLKIIIKDLNITADEFMKEI